MDSDCEQDSSSGARALDRWRRFHSAFLTAMSHELRTPLNGIIGFSELMCTGRAGEMSRTQREYLGDILICARRMLRLVSDLDELVRLDASDRRPAAPVDLAKLVAAVIEALRDPAATRRIAVTAEIADDARAVVSSPTALRQVLHHYIAAALQFAPEGGRVVLSARRDGADRVRIDVEETGTAIPQVDVAPLLVDFDQLDARSKTLHRGVGLGLALARRLVLAEGGRVEFSSQSGTGSTFSAILPCASVLDPGGGDGA